MTKRIVAISPGFVFYTRVSLLRSRTLCCCCAWALMLSARQPGPKSPLRCCSQAVAAVDSAAVAGAGDEVEREKPVSSWRQWPGAYSGPGPVFADIDDSFQGLAPAACACPAQAGPPPGRENVQG